ncbi:MAG: hypothetical protein QJR14_06640 [Bacillota bacterium]|nr:hypothetical protein [Bacillota bacterium]
MDDDWKTLEEHLGAARSGRGRGRGKEALPFLRRAPGRWEAGWQLEGRAAALLLQAAMDRGPELLARFARDLERAAEAGAGSRQAGAGAAEGLRLRLALRGRPPLPALELILPAAEPAAGPAAALLRGWAQGGAAMEGRRLEVALAGEPEAAPAGEPEAAGAAAAAAWLEATGWLDFALGSAHRAPAHRSVG